MILLKLGGLLQQCSKLKSYVNGTSLHAALVKAGGESDLFLCNHLVNLYAKCDEFEAAHQMFDNMPRRNLVSWSAMVSGYDQAGKPSLALSLFAKMEFRPNEYIYASVIRSCARLLAIAQGEQVHADALKAGYSGISFVSNSLLSMYMKCGCFNEAYSVFSTMSEPNSVSYNAMITGFVDNSQMEKGLELFGVMNRQGLHMDQFSFVAVFGTCTNMEDLDTGIRLHCQTIKLGLDITAFVGNVILTMYSKCSSISEVEKVFESIEEKDVITWNTYIVACSYSGEHGKGLMVFKKMREMENEFGVSPDDFTLTSALAACAELALIRYGGQIHAQQIRNRVDIDVGVGNAIINMYAKCGCIKHASCVFHLLPSRNLFSWNTIIVGLGNHGHGNRAVELFEQLRLTGISPDSITFVGLLAACNHAGLVDEGLAYFNSMKVIYGISPGIEHLSCLVDLLGRAGRLEEAEDYLQISPFRNDSVVWGSLLSSCRIHKDVVIGERVARKILELQPRTSSPYVLLSSLYASDARWDGVAAAWKLLKDSGVKKEPGYSIIEVKGIMQKFTAGGFSNGKIEEVVETLEILACKAKEF
ncbi:pentatricopeptide repeat-containing protein At4g33170-like [Typha latifolia]|uniref:pentatricopeptide repeat-containing protein At4g33170-like n=1 Tax=Typha latifolia TaxID=4733 RepID=UPI003C2F383C